MRAPQRTYGKIKAANPAFAKKVAGCAPGTALMRAIGFAEQTLDGESHWVWGGRLMARAIGFGAAARRAARRAGRAPYRAHAT